MSSVFDWARRAGIFALVLMVVSSMVAPSAMAATSTTTPEDECNYGAIPELGNTVHNLLGIETKDCARQQAQEIVSNSTWVDGYSSGLGLADLQKGSLTPVENHLEDSKTYARTIVKTEAVKAYNNGSNESQIDSIVNESVDDYYATMEKNVWTAHSTNSLQAYYIYEAFNQSVSEDNALYLADKPHQNGSVGSAVVRYADSDYNHGPVSGAWAYNPGLDGDNTTITNTTVTHLDGSTETYPVIEFYATYERYYGDPSDNLNRSQGGTPDKQPYNLAAYVVHPDRLESTKDPDLNNYYYTGLTKNNSVQIYSEYAYKDALYQIEQTSDDVKVNGEQFVDLLFANYNQSEGVNITEVLNPNDLATQWNSNYNSTGYYGWIAATLGMTGLEGNVNSSFAINYTPRVNHTDNGNYTLNGSGQHDYAYVAGESYNVSGTLMTDWDPNPNESYAFERGATHDTANADAPVLFIEQLENDSRVVRLNGTFTVSELTNVKTGETINSTSLEEQNQQTWEANSTVTEIRKLIEYRNKSVNVVGSSDGSGGGGGGFNFGFDAGMAGIGALVVLAGGLYVVSSGASKAS